MSAWGYRIMKITADRLLDSLKKKTTDPELRALLAEPGVSQEGAKLNDGFGDIPAIQHGIRLFFKFARYHSARALRPSRECQHHRHPQ